VDEKDAHNSVIALTLEVNNRVHLARVMKRLRNLPAVIRIARP
jgi:GTP pyrophosphokinase